MANDGKIKIKIHSERSVPEGTMIVFAPRPAPCPHCGLWGCPDDPRGPLPVVVATNVGHR